MLEEYPQITRAITGTPWMIVPENLQGILDIVNMRLSGQAFTDEEIRIRLDAAESANSNRENPRIQVGGGVGVVSLNGPIFPKANLLTMLSGATSLDTFTSDLRELVANDSVKQIVIDFNTPGGASDMVAETGSVIKELSAEKPIYGMANTICGSAGLWLMSQCTKAYSTPSGSVGSLGVYTTHTDISGQDANDGKKITIVGTPDFKAALSPHQALSAEGRQYMTDTVTELYGDFVDAVATGRGKTTEYVKDNFGEGKMLSAKKASEVGMIDGVVSMNDFLGQLVESNSSTTFTRAKGDLAYNVNRMHSLLEQGGKLLVTPEVVENKTTHYHVTVPKLSEGGEMDENQIREILGLSADADITKAISDLHAEVEPLRELKAATSKRETFKEMFPDEFERMSALEATDRERASKEFENNYVNSRVTRTKGDGDAAVKELTGLGFSGLALTEIGAFANKINAGDVKIEDFKGVIDSILNDGIVDYKQTGSSRLPDEKEADKNTTVPDNYEDVKTEFGKLLATVQSEPEFKNEDFNTQLAEAATRNPDLAAAWRTGHPRIHAVG